MNIIELFKKWWDEPLPVKPKKKKDEILFEYAKLFLFLIEAPFFVLASYMILLVGIDKIMPIIESYVMENYTSLTAIFPVIGIAFIVALWIMAMFYTFNLAKWLLPNSFSEEVTKDVQK